MTVGSVLQNSTKRIESLDFLRGIAAAAVMLFHYTASTSIELAEENPLRIAGSYGHFGVEVFFIVSGFVIPYSMHLAGYSIRRFHKFMMKRMVRIEIPYLAIILAEIILIYISSMTPWKTGVSERLDFSNILLHVGYLNGFLEKPWLIPVFWTLAIEFQFYLFAALLFPAIANSKLTYRLYFTVSFMVLTFIVPYSYLFFSYGLLFITGILIFQYRNRIINHAEFYCLFTILVILVYLHQGATSSVVTCLTAVIILFAKVSWQWTLFLGMVSYSVYLVHVPFGGRLLLLTQLYVEEDWIKSLLIIVYLLLTVCVAWIFYLLIERPSLLLSKRIIYKQQTEDR